MGGTFPYAFTEHGVLQLSNILKSGRAVQVSINIIEVFVKMREMILSNQDILLQLEENRKTLHGHEDRIDTIYNYLVQFVQKEKQPRQKIVFKPNGR